MIESGTIKSIELLQSQSKTIFYSRSLKSNSDLTKRMNKVDIDRFLKEIMAKDYNLRRQTEKKLFKSCKNTLKKKHRL